MAGSKPQKARLVRSTLHVGFNEYIVREQNMEGKAIIVTTATGRVFRLEGDGPLYDATEITSFTSFGQRVIQWWRTTGHAAA